MFKHIHLTAIVISLALFFVRYLWVMKDSPMMQKKWVKVVPHVVDTVLLASAIALCVILSQYPLVNGWLTEKVIGLVLYIGLGMVALKLGSTKQIKSVAFVFAVAVIVVMGKLAVTKQPYLF